MRNPDRVVRALIRTQFLVTMKNGDTWRGTLLACDPTTLDLAYAEAVGRDGTHTPADGHVLLARADVAFIQRT